MKTQNSLRIHAVWSVFVVRMKKLCVLVYPKCLQFILCLDCVNAQADLSLRWAHMHEGSFSHVAANYFFIIQVNTQRRNNVATTLRVSTVTTL